MLGRCKDLGKRACGSKSADSHAAPALAHPAEDVATAKVRDDSALSAASIQDAAVSEALQKRHELQEQVQLADQMRRLKMMKKRLKVQQRLDLLIRLNATRQAKAQLCQEANTEALLLEQLQEKQALVDELRKLQRHQQMLQVPLMLGPPDWTGGGSLWSAQKSGEQISYALEDNGRIMSNETLPVDVTLSTQPFALGGCRAAYFAMVGTRRCVLKRLLRESEDLAANVADLEMDVNAHLLARSFANRFNSQRPTFYDSVHYHDVSILKLRDVSDEGGQVAYLLEPFLHKRQD